MDFSARIGGDEDLRSLVEAEIADFEAKMQAAQTGRLEDILRASAEQQAYLRCEQGAGDWVGEAEEWLRLIRHFYPNDERGQPSFALDFYAYKLEKLREHTDESESELLRLHLLEAWRQRLQERIWAEDLRRVEAERERFMLHLHERIDRMEELKKLLAPLELEEGFGRFWDLAKGEWTRTSSQALQKYAEKIARNPHLQELARLLGKMRAAQTEYELERRKERKSRQETHFLRGQKEELIGLRLSQDIAQTLPSQLALLADKSTENLFLRDWAAHRLLTREYQHKYLTTHYEEQTSLVRRPKKTDKGAIIICVDTSASMEGAAEEIAKTLAFAIVRIALRERRPCFLISFSTRIQTLDLSRLQESLSLLVEFLAMSFHGGTDATPALQEALRKLQTQQFRRADVLMISDFVMTSLPKTITATMQKSRQDLGARFFSLCVATGAQARAATAIFDQQWTYDPRDEKSLLKLLRLLGETS